MSVNIKLKDSTVGKSVRIGNNANFSCMGDVDIDIDNVDVRQSIEMLNSADSKEIDGLMAQIEMALEKMDANSAEYNALMRLVSQTYVGKGSIKQKIKEHMASFATGILANIVSDYFLH